MIVSYWSTLSTSAKLHLFLYKRIFLVSQTVVHKTLLLTNNVLLFISTDKFDGFDSKVLSVRYISVYLHKSTFGCSSKPAKIGMGKSQLIKLWAFKFMLDSSSE